LTSHIVRIYAGVDGSVGSTLWPKSGSQMWIGTPFAPRGMSKPGEAILLALFISSGRSLKRVHPILQRQRHWPTKTPRLVDR
jgi:hypothetical protein